MAKPNYRHQKKQKEQARKLRQAEKQNRRLTARIDADGNALAPPGDDTATLPPEASPAQAET